MYSPDFMKGLGYAQYCGRQHSRHRIKINMGPAMEGLEPCKEGEKEVMKNKTWINT